MKKKKTFFLLCIMAALASAFILLSDCRPAAAIEGPKHGKLIFSYDDARNDDYGPGSYRYPQGPLFKGNNGMFDITTVRIYEVGEFYRFDIEYKGRMIRSWSGYRPEANGWLFNIAEIYIDTDHKWGSGHGKAIYGRNLTFNENSRWEKVVFISPINSDVMRNAIRDKTEDLEFVATAGDFVFPVNIDVYASALSATVRKSDIGEYNENWGIQVLSTALDDDSTHLTFFNKRVYKNPTDEEFGGGTDLFGAPNVIDMITPKGFSQKDILSKYSPHPNYNLAEFARIPCVYKDETAGGTAAEASSARRDKADAAVSARTGDLALKAPNDGQTDVMERVFEAPSAVELTRAKDEKAAKEIKPVVVAKAASMERSEDNLPGDAGGLNLDKLKKAEKTEDASENKASEKMELNKSDKQIKNKSDSKKSGTSKNAKPKNYEDFLKKLNEQDGKLKKSDEDSDAFDDVDRFLKKDQKAVYPKTPKNSKLAEFNSDVYEMARITGKQEVRVKNKKAKSEEAQAAARSAAVEKAPAAAAKAPAVNESKPLIESAPAGTVKNDDAESEPEDKSIMGRIFGKKHKKNKKPEDVNVKLKLDADKAVDELENYKTETGTKVLSQDAIIEMANSELPDNERKKGSGAKGKKAAVKSETVENAGAADPKKDGGCVGNMKSIKEAAVKYLEAHPDAKKISMSALMVSGLLAAQPKCPEGGRYLIEIESGKPVITCINLNNSGHGKY